MNKTLKILICFGAMAVMSIPFFILVDMNRNAVSANTLHLNGTFRTFSVIFGVQYLLSLIGSFLLYVRTIDHSDSETSGCLTLAFAGVTAVIFYKLNDFGDGWISGGNDPFSRLMHPDWSSLVFYECLTVCWIQIMIAAAALASGKLQDD